MVQYRCAFDVNGRVVDAIELKTHGYADNATFSCVVCRQRLVAKVKGEKREPHFAHYPGADCHPETYLHRLAKQVFYEVYRDCIEHSVPFHIELTHPTICRNYSDMLGHACDLQRPVRERHDLVKIFDDITMEPRTDGFIPDLLLFKRSQPAQRVFIEIAVMHFSETPKLISPNKIIEIPIKTDDDVGVIRKRLLTEGNAQFINFGRSSAKVTDADCKCHSHKTYAFVVYESGKCRLFPGMLCEIRRDLSRVEDKIHHIRLYNMSSTPPLGFFPTEASIFRQGIENALFGGVEIKNCFICRHRKPNDTSSSDQKVYCKKLENTFPNSNQGADCDSYEYDPLAIGRAERALRRRYGIR